MGTVTIFNHTTKNPISMIGEMAGTCWGADTTNQEKNYKRGIECLNNEHGRTWEFPDVYAKIDDYSAKCLREWYTHIGGAPTRLQESTRYIDYTKDGFGYVTPHTIANNKEANKIWDNLMETINGTIVYLEKQLGIPREDASMCLPLTMESSMVDKRNFRNIWDMAHQRLCTRAYWEYRELLRDYLNALKDYSEEWKYLIDNYIMPKCEYFGYCKEKKSCGRKPKFEQ